MRAFHFCIEYHDTPGQIQIMDGVVTTELDPFLPSFHAEIKESLAAAMTPPRPIEHVVLRSLSLLA